jgi:hypothetical protein
MAQGTENSRHSTNQVTKMAISNDVDDDDDSLLVQFRVAMDPTVCSQSHSTLSTTTIPNQMAAS